MLSYSPGSRPIPRVTSGSRAGAGARSSITPAARVRPAPSWSTGTGVGAGSAPVIHHFEHQQHYFSILSEVLAASFQKISYFHSVITPKGELHQ